MQRKKQTMNIMKKIGVKIADFGKWLAGEIKSVVGLAIRIEHVLQSEKPLEKPFIEGLSTVVADVEALIASSENALGANGLNFAADSKVYTGFVTLIEDFRKLAPVVEQALAILEGKETPSAPATAK
jgi:hypothetical protein